MAGIPPLAGFFGKYFLFLTAFSAEYYAIVFVGMSTSLISTYYYLRFIKIMWFEESFAKFINIHSLSLLTTLNYAGLIAYFLSILFLILFIFLNKYVFFLTTLMVLI
jgi:NADH-quinone oxidoreductase subunit N